MFGAHGTEFLEPATCIWREVDGELVGAWAFTGHSSDTIQAHYVGLSKFWLTRELLRRVFTYCFEHLGVKVILGFLPPDCTYARDVAIKLGFKYFGVIPGVGIHMMTMTRPDCRWLELNSRCLNG